MAERSRGKVHPAPPQVEMFYNDIFASGRKHGLSDAAVVAVLAKILGRFLNAPDNTAQDRQTFEDTIIYNMIDGKEEIGRLIEAVRRPN